MIPPVFPRQVFQVLSGSRHFEEFGGVLSPLGAVGQAGEHPGELFETSSAFDLDDLGSDTGAPHDVVALGKGCHLWQVGHGQHLALEGQVPQLATHGEGRGSPDTSVDLIERYDGCLSDAGRQVKGKDEPAQLPS